MALRQLKAQYQGQNVLFIDQDVDYSVGGRLGRWFAAWDQPDTIYLPLVMVDSGNEISNGSVQFVSVYSEMVDLALDRPAKAQMAVSGKLEGDLLHLEATLP